MAVIAEPVTTTRPSLAFERLYADANGDSHFGPLSVAIAERLFAPPARAFWVSPLDEAARQGFLLVPAGWVGALHPSPLRMWIFVLAGAMEFEASDGERRPLSAGSALLLEDITGKGHVSKVIGTADATLAVVQLPDN
ncbi:cupin domain-containing protein [Cupriavidus necator]|uniref:Cupin domain-containing protein n=1 Tax=Cupriavidus necator TaxID=106590 RepID=A0A367PCX4_CUPNE|nr:cupin domain-containing protein [Cupriavidus necator]QQX87276.1 cupin domain-containing protein [Cupriavidus necator]RCJ05699.1 cupin domain-containing protein [Cupriavidus necator]